METIIGLLIVAILVWATVIIFQKTRGTTNLEKVILVSGLVCLILYFIGTAS